jgi:hypothetical protein
LPTLLKMATSFAKLALRREVTEEDALIACYLYEEFITSIFGNSLLGKFYLRHFLSVEIKSFCVAWIFSIRWNRSSHKE